jgi:tight adherence protein C
MLPLFTAIAASVTVLVLVVWYGRSKGQHDERLRALLEPQRMLVEDSDAFTQRVAFPVVNSLINVLLAILPTALIAGARRWLVTAGDTMSLAQFLIVALISGSALPALYFVVAWVIAGGLPPLLALLPVVLLGVAGLLLPFYFLRRAARKRQQVIWRSMPNAMDLLTTCVEAGLSLDFGLQRVADKYEGPLSDEIHRALREVALGKPRKQALLDMAERIDVPDVTTFINSVVHAETLGTSVGQVLRVQAEQMRLRRRQRAEQIARQAPVKMAMPLVFFLMPSLFIVTIGPVVLSVMRAFNDG